MQLSIFDENVTQTPLFFPQAFQIGRITLMDALCSLQLSERHQPLSCPCKPNAVQTDGVLLTP